ncbi:MAG: 4Fe-4S dicluster domain-containing protein [Thermodesulfobacteriota bacterium]
MYRRTFLKIAGLGSVAVAAGCSEPEKTLYSLVQAPDDMVTGKPSWYASTCRECPAGCGILAKNREGRVVKIEGNPQHPINRGKICMRGQAALQGIYNPDRLKTPLLKENNQWRKLSFAEAQRLLKEKAAAASQKGRGRIGMITEMAGANLLSLLSQALKSWGSPPPLVFEPFAYESLKAANHRVLGVDGLPSYRMEQADFLLSFGADFLETWLSPVEYGIKFKQMHSVKDGRKNLFYHVGPYQSLTGANADVWLPCNPGSEAALAMSLVHESMLRGKGAGLSEELQKIVAATALPFTGESAAQLAGISIEQYRLLLDRVTASRRPLILGTGSGSASKNSLQTNMAANLLNLVLNPDLELFDFNNRHSIEIADSRESVLKFFNAVDAGGIDLLLLNNVNPVFALPPRHQIDMILQKDALFVVSFSSFLDETTQSADLILPTRLPLETWDAYSGKLEIISMLQPAMGRLTDAPHLGDVFLNIASSINAPIPPESSYKEYLYSSFIEKRLAKSASDWVLALRAGGYFEASSRGESVRPKFAKSLSDDFKNLSPPAETGLTFIAAPSLRFYDGRGANRPWLCEIPDSLTQIAWQTPVRMHPQTLKQFGLRQEDIVHIQSRWGSLEAPVYETHSVKPGVLVMEIGQGHANYGRYAQGAGVDPCRILPDDPNAPDGGPLLAVSPVAIKATGRRLKLAHLDGSRFQHGRRIAQAIALKDLTTGPSRAKPGVTLEDFPLTLPIPEGYDPKRDIYPPHDHDTYRWSMVVDLDKCIGCNACAAACYAENNLGVVGLEQVRRGREMSWIRVERYLDANHPDKTLFLPMLCQHCDNAPCESVCPVYAPHHSNEGLNNQIYNRCIGTRFCSQNCPYKVRRFNWYAWEFPSPLNLQLNPDVTARSKGVMEKCSFCVQRIKFAHGVAKDEGRPIRDGEVQPACLQACPTGALTFGNLMDPRSRVRKLAADPRAYQVLGYLNTKPAVIYLKKVLPEI